MTKEMKIDNGLGFSLVTPFSIKNPIWNNGKYDLQNKMIVRDLLQKCSGDKIVEMLKSILSVEEKTALVKTELESFFENQTKSFENHMKKQEKIENEVEVNSKNDSDIQGFIY